MLERLAQSWRRTFVGCRNLAISRYNFAIICSRFGAKFHTDKYLCKYPQGDAVTVAIRSLPLRAPHSGYMHSIQYRAHEI
jgi:hypothetical protein